MDIFKTEIYGGHQCYYMDVESRKRQIKNCEKIEDLDETLKTHEEDMQKTVLSCLVSRKKSLVKKLGNQ